MQYFTADTHFGFPGILVKLRNFADVDEGNSVILDGINSTVGRDDTLWIVGDFSNNARVWRPKIKCKDVRIILGNHDKPVQCQETFGVRKTFVRRTMRLKDSYCVLDHHPPIYWDGSHKGYMCLYGHTHDAREEYLDNLFPERRSMDCGVDTAKRILGEWRPFSEDEIYDLIGDRKGHDPVSYSQKLRGEK